jgi:hypothetical protein
MFKCGLIYERARMVAASTKALLQGDASYGKVASAEEIAEAGDNCAICQVRGLNCVIC